MNIPKIAEVPNNYKLERLFYHDQVFNYKQTNILLFGFLGEILLIKRETARTGSTHSSICPMIHYNAKTYNNVKIHS